MRSCRCKQQQNNIAITIDFHPRFFVFVISNQIQKSNKAAKAPFEPVKLPGLTCDVDVVGLDLPNASLRGQPEEAPAHGGRAQGASSNMQTRREQPAPLSSYFQMREGSGGKFDVHCFLFTDMLLVCKSLSRKGERVKVSMIMVIMMMM